jgi:glycosyltransferase involved in cell wall biosynthesis
MDPLRDSTIFQHSCSVVMPVYNAEKWLRQSITSILMSMRAHDELVIVNDGSTDGSTEILKEFSVSDSRMSIFTLDHQGLVSALNFGIENAKHEFIARADADDTYAARRLDFQLQELIADEDLGAVFTDYELRDERGRIIGVIPTSLTPNMTYLSLVNPQRTAHPSVVFRKSVFYMASKYQEEDFPVEDYALWLRMVAVSKISSVPETLLFYQVHSKSVSRLNRELQLDKVRMLRKTLIANFPTDFDWKTNIRFAAKVYSASSLGNLRSVLAFRDIVATYRLAPGKIPLTTLISSFFWLRLLNIKTFSSIGRLLIYRLKMANLR